MTLPNLSIRRVAILIATLDTESADRLLEQMTPEDASQVRRMMIDLNEIDATEEEAVIDEFLRAGVVRGDVDDEPLDAEGVELCISSTATSSSDRHVEVERQEPEQQAVSAGSLLECSPRSLLEDVTTERLLPLLLEERPQAVALVISRLSPARALETLDALPSELQAEVLKRWVELQHTDNAVAQQIEEDLHARIVHRFGAVGGRATGLAQLAHLVQKAAPRLKQQLLAHLEQHDLTPIDKQSPPQLAFEDLEYFNDAGLAGLLREADPQIVVLALAGAPEAFFERTLKQLQPAAARRLRRAVESLGPTRLSDISAAQQELADLAAELCSRSQARISRLPSGAAE